MTERLIVEDLERWNRFGRGRSLQFFATDEEVQEWLIRGLPEAYAPYSLVGADKVQHAGRYIDQPFQCEVSAFLDNMHGPSGSRYNFWLRSAALSPDLPVQREVHLDKMMSYNGLVLLQHGLQIKDRRTPARQMCRTASRIAIVDRIQNLETGEILQRNGYLNIYTTLQALIRKALVYSSIVWDAPGQESESDLEPWTEGAVRLFEAGFPFWNKPGQPLASKRKPKPIVRNKKQ